MVDSLNCSYDYGELSNSQKEAIITLIEKKDKDKRHLSMKIMVVAQALNVTMRNQKYCYWAIVLALHKSGMQCCFRQYP